MRGTRQLSGSARHSTTRTRLGRLLLVTPIIACALLLALPQLGAATVVPVKLVPPFGRAVPGSTANYTQIQDSIVGPHCSGTAVSSNITAPTVFNPATGLFRFGGTSSVSVSPPSARTCEIGGEILGFATYTGAKFVAPVSGLGVVREYWDLNWNFSYSTHATGSGPNHDCETYYSVTLLSLVYEPSIGAQAANGAMGLYNGTSRCNSSGTIAAPGHVSYPMVVALTKGETYELDLTLDVSFWVHAGYNCASAASLTFDKSNPLRLTEVTVR
jgi:hypothetical protein